MPPTLTCVNYAYDGLDRRISKDVDANGDGTVDRGERYAYDGDDLSFIFTDVDGSGPAVAALNTRLLQGPDVDQLFADETALGEVLWTLSDHQGTVRDVADFTVASNSTAVINHIRYDSFGKIIAETNPATGTAATAGRIQAGEIVQGFTGREYDPDTGLSWYRARWYDPSLGRFLSEDPSGFDGGDLNLTRYVGNSPWNYSDPSGMVRVSPTSAVFGSSGTYVRQETAQEKAGDLFAPWDPRASLSVGNALSTWATRLDQVAGQATSAVLNWNVPDRSLASFSTFLGAAGDGAHAGKFEVINAWTTPYSYVTGNEVAGLQEARSNAWAKTDLQGTWTQSFTTGLAGTGAAAGYTAGALEFGAYAGITEIGTANSLGSLAGIAQTEAYVIGSTGTLAPAAYLNSLSRGQTLTTVGLSTSKGNAFDPSRATVGTTVTGVDPNTLEAGRRNLVESRLQAQMQLIQSRTTRFTPITVTQNGVIFDGNHGTRAAIDSGTLIDVRITGETAQGFGAVKDLPITPR